MARLRASVRLAADDGLLVRCAGRACLTQWKPREPGACICQNSMPIRMRKLAFCLWPVESSTATAEGMGNVTAPAELRDYLKTHARSPTRSRREASEASSRARCFVGRRDQRSFMRKSPAGPGSSPAGSACLDGPSTTGSRRRPGSGRTECPNTGPVRRAFSPCSSLPCKFAP